MGDIVDLSQLKYTEALIVDAFTYFLAFHIKQSKYVLGIAACKWISGSTEVQYTMACDGLVQTFGAKLPLAADHLASDPTLNLSAISRSAKGLVSHMFGVFAKMAEDPSTPYVARRWHVLPFVDLGSAPNAA